ncbi:class F sortase [Catenulispora sp. NF23]|uniref:Class F sortase n=1 Tax=Catenulispora pinistramenti TaxID=2705254 RepID=A0ABS5L818_9ACTN|nr:class F sortase [Catenulispora pinistramenti]MBS2539756.1 class F sortase [Catenulispora pinistramenti]MBS2554481.1 class F sortase [Catenulispora pinistramenti]
MRPVWTRGWPAWLAALMLAGGCGAASGPAAAGSGRTAGGTGTTSASASAGAAGAAGGSVGTPASGSAGGSSGSKAGGSSNSGAIARSVPVRLQIPGIGVDTPVISLGLASDGTVQVPPIQADSPAGWYRGSPTPGQTGPSVILGHVTVGKFGDGVFLRLAKLRPGDRVTVGLQDGASADFTVDSVQTVSKDHFPTQQVYGNVNRPELRLITCGGPRTDDGYLDNVVVFASLAGSAG